MKKNHILILGLTLLVSGCSQEELWNKQSTASEERTFTASFEQNESRTYIDEGNLQRWTKADKISLFEGDTLNSQYQFEGETGDRSGTFTKVSSPNNAEQNLNNNYAVYPYSSDIQITENGMITVILPKEQKYAINSFGLGDNTMVAVTQNTEDTSLKFKNVGGYLKLQLYGDNVTIKSITLKGNSGEKLAGKATITPIYGEIPTINMTDKATESITLNCGDGIKIGTTAETATEFLIVVPPTIFENGFTIKVANTENIEFVKSTSNRIVLERNVIKPMAAIKLEAALVPFPDISGTWVFPMFSSGYELQTLSLNGISGKTAYYDVSPEYGANSVGVYMDKKENGKIEVRFRVVSTYGSDSYTGGVFNEDFTVVTGTHKTYVTSSTGRQTTYEAPWTIYKYNN